MTAILLGDNKKITTSKTKSRSCRAGLKFPVSRINRILKKGHYATRVGCAASVFLAGVLEYLVAEIVEVAGTAAFDNNRVRIIPRHVMLAIRNDNELDEVFKRITLCHGGYLPRMQPQTVKKTKIIYKKVVKI